MWTGDRVPAGDRFDFHTGYSGLNRCRTRKTTRSASLYMLYWLAVQLDSHHSLSNHLYCIPRITLLECLDQLSDLFAWCALLPSLPSDLSMPRGWSGGSKKSLDPRSIRPFRCGISPRKRRCFVILVSESSSALRTRQLIPSQAIRPGCDRPQSQGDGRKRGDGSRDNQGAF